MKQTLRLTCGGCPIFISVPVETLKGPNRLGPALGEHGWSLAWADYPMPDGSMVRETVVVCPACDLEERPIYSYAEAPIILKEGRPAFFVAMDAHVAADPNTD